MPAFLQQQGIFCIGNWILDQHRRIDHWPKQGTLANVLQTRETPGGSAANVALNLKALQVPFAVDSCGCLGQDLAAQVLKGYCEQYGLSTAYLQEVPGVTSTTDVYFAEDTLERTFFHQRGANQHFDMEHLPWQRLQEQPPKLCHLGYLGLLDKLDGADADYGLRSACLLARLQALGIQTSVDLVSVVAGRLKACVLPALPFIDHLIINEVEVAELVGEASLPMGYSQVAPEVSQLSEALFALGLKQTLVVHYPEGAVWFDRDGGYCRQASTLLAPSEIRNNCGAGDAFCAGVLMGLHQAWPPQQTLVFAHKVACLSLKQEGSILPYKVRVSYLRSG